MPFEYQCPSCGNVQKLRDRVTQTKRKCPACGEPITPHSIDRDQADQRAAAAARQAAANKKMLLGCGGLLAVGVVLAIIVAVAPKRNRNEAAPTEIVAGATVTKPSTMPKPQDGIYPQLRRPYIPNPETNAPIERPAPGTMPTPLTKRSIVTVRPIPGEVVFIADNRNGYDLYETGNAEVRKELLRIGRVSFVQVEIRGDLEKGPNDNYVHFRMPEGGLKPRSYIVKRKHAIITEE